MAKVIDARGLPCPQPVILTRTAMQEQAEIVVIVDNDEARRNVTGMAEKVGAVVQAENKKDGIYLSVTVTGEKAAGGSEPENSEPAKGPLVLVIPGEFMGRGEEELGHILMRSFLYTLNEVSPSPDSIIFFNSGVKLVVEGSEVLDDLHKLADSGIRILACGTCLGHYNLKEKIAVGEISNMYTIAETMLQAGKIISI